MPLSPYPTIKRRQIGLAAAIIVTLIIIGHNNRPPMLEEHSGTANQAASTGQTAPITPDTPARRQQAEAQRKAAAKAEKERARQEKIAARAQAKKLAAEQAEAQRKQREEYDVDGLVLLRQTVTGVSGEFTTEIKGTVVNRRDHTLGYAQISFNLYDSSGAQVGTALANINNLEAGGRWKFSASSFGREFSTYKFAELSGF